MCCNFWDEKLGLENVRTALSKASIHQFEGAGTPGDDEEILQLKKSSLGLLVDSEMIKELVAAASVVDADGNLLKGAAVGEEKLSLGPKCDGFFNSMLSPLPTSSIPVERAINHLKYKGFGRGVGIQSRLRTEAKVGAGLDVDVDDVTLSDWRKAANAVRAAEGTHVDDSEEIEEAKKAILGGSDKDKERRQKELDKQQRELDKQQAKLDTAARKEQREVANKLKAIGKEERRVAKEIEKRKREEEGTAVKALKKNTKVNSSKVLTTEADWEDRLDRIHRGNNTSGRKRKPVNRDSSRSLCKSGNWWS